MQQHVLFAHGYDVPGVGSAITKTLFDCSCNIDNFKMTTMEGLFSLIVIFTPHEPIPATQLEAMLLDSVSPLNVEINLLTGNAPNQALRQLYEEWIPHRITITCDNRAGLLYFFMRDMSRMDINIMDVRCFPVEPDNERNSYIICKVEVPINISMENLRQSLKSLSKDLHVDIDIEPIEDLEID